MLSGEFEAVPISSISVDRANRQRRELTGIEELAVSMRDNGQFHPVIVHRDTGILVTGERRLAAAKSLGWDAIHVQWADELEPDQLHAIELEENIKRVDLSWQDRVRAVEEYHKLRAERDPTWTLEKTADALGSSKTVVASDIAVSREMRANPKIAEASQLSAAKNLVQRTLERRKASEASSITAALEVKRDRLIIHQNFNEWAWDYQGPKFNFLHCDFPYGINMDKTSQGTHHETQAMYEDTKDTYFQLLRTLQDTQDIVMDESCHIMFWFHMNYYIETVNCLEDCGFVVNPVPLIWHKTDNTGIISDPNRRPRHIYETALLGARGDRKLVRPKSDVIGHPTVSDTFHSANKPASMLRHFFEMLVDDTTVMLDPTAGSGSAVKLCKAMGAKYVLGLEKEKEFVQQANREPLK